MIRKVNHIGIAVKSLEEAIPLYEKSYGIACTSREEVPSQKVKVAMFQVACTRIELLEPTSPDSPIAKFIESKGEGIHHIAFETDDIAAQLQKAKDSGVRLINETPVPGAHDMQVAFLHPKSTFGVLTEFCAESTHH